MKKSNLVKKNSSQLKTTNMNNDWFKNVIKSVGYASADLVKETLPATFDFVQGNTQDIADLYNDMRDQAKDGNHKRLQSLIANNPTLKHVKEAKKNALEDLRSGKIYNKEREERAVLDDDDDEDFDFDDGFDFDDIDDDDDYNEDIDVKTKGSTTNIQKKVTVNNINANISKNNPMVRALDSQSQLIVATADETNRTNVALATNSSVQLSSLSQNLTTGVSVLNDNLSAMVNFQNDSMSKYIAASLKYYEESLTTLNSSLEQLKVGIGVNNQEKNNNEQEQLNPFLSGGALNIKEYGKVIKNNAKNLVDDNLILNMVFNQMLDEDMLKMWAASPLSAVTKTISTKLVPAMMREAAAGFDATLEGFFPAMMQKFNKMYNDSDNPLLSAVGALFGFREKEKTSVDISKYDRGPMSFNGITQKAIVEVIPTYLRKILSVVSGKNEQVFDYNSGKFIDYMDARKKADDEYQNRILSSMESFSEVNERLGAIRFDNPKERDEMMKAFRKFMVKSGTTTGGVNPVAHYNKSGNYVDEFADMFDEGDLKYREIIRGAIQSLSNQSIMKFRGSDVYNAKRARTKYNTDAEENIGNSILPSLEAWDSVKEYKQTDDKKGYTLKSDIQSRFKDKWGQTQLDYLKEIRDTLLEGLIVFPSGGNIGTSNKTNNGIITPSSLLVGLDGNILSTNPDDSDIFNKRTNRIKTIKDVNTSKEQKLQDKSHVTINPRTEEEIKRDNAKGITQFGDVQTASNAQIVDVFKTYSDNIKAEEKAQEASEVSAFNKMFGKNFVVKKIEDMYSAPGKVIGNIFNELDNVLYKIVFGVSKEGNEDNQSFVSKIGDAIKDQFGGFFDWTKKTFYEPMKDAFIGKEGVITKMKQSQMMQKVKGWMGKSADGLFGKKNEKGYRENGALSEVYNDLKDATNATKQIFTGKDYVNSKGEKKVALSSVSSEVKGMVSPIWKNSKAYLFGNQDKTVESNVEIARPTRGISSARMSGQLRSEVQVMQDFNNGKQAFGPQKLVSADQYSKISIPTENSLSPIDPIDEEDVNKVRSKLAKQNWKGAKNLKGRNREIYEKYKDHILLERNREKYIKDLVDRYNKSGKVSDKFTKSERKFIKKNPNVFGKSTDGGMGGSLNGFKYFSQNDPAIAGVPYETSMANRGCGPAAMAMVGSQMTGSNIDPVSMAQLSTEGGFSNESGTKGNFFKSMGSALGIGGKQHTTTKSGIINSLQDNNSVVLRGQSNGEIDSPFTEAGHYVVGVKSSDKSVTINDPRGPEYSGDYDLNKVVNQSNKMWDFSSKEDGGMGGSKIKFKSKKKLNRTTSKTKEGHMSNFTRNISEDGRINGLVNEIKDGILEGAQDFNDMFFGEKQSDQERESSKAEFANKFKEKLPKGIAGAIGGVTVGAIASMGGGLGMMGSLFLPGGIFGAALLGSALGFAGTSDKFKQWAFGTPDEKTGEKVGGFISDKTQKFFKNNKVAVVGGASLGLAKGLIGSTGVMGSMLFGGPITGALVGAGMGIALKSESFRDALFGKKDLDGKREGKMLSKLYNKTADGKKSLGKAILGGAAGAGIGLVVGNMGIIGGLIGGPVMGTIAGSLIGIASSSDKWKDMMFGKIGEDDKRHGGMTETVKNFMTHQVLVPLKDTMQETVIDMKHWFNKTVISGLKFGLGPIKDLGKQILGTITTGVSSVVSRITTGFSDMIVTPISKFLDDKIFSKFRTVMGGLFKGAKGLAKFTLGAPFKALEFVGGKVAKGIEKKANKRVDKKKDVLSKLTPYINATDEEKAKWKPYQKKENAKLQRKYDMLKALRPEKYTNYYEDYTNKKKEYKQNVKAKFNEERANFKATKELNGKKRKFHNIFGYDMEYDEEMNEKYSSMMLDANGKPLKMFKKRKALKNVVSMAQQERAKKNLQNTEVVTSGVIIDFKDKTVDKLTIVADKLTKIVDLMSKGVKLDSGSIDDIGKETAKATEVSDDQKDVSIIPKKKKKKKKRNRDAIRVAKRNIEPISDGGMGDILNGFPYFSQNDPRYSMSPYKMSDGGKGGLLSGALKLGGKLLGKTKGLGKSLIKGLGKSALVGGAVSKIGNMLNKTKDGLFNSAKNGIGNILGSLFGSNDGPNGGMMSSSVMPIIISNNSGTDNESKSNSVVKDFNYYNEIDNKRDKDNEESLFRNKMMDLMESGNKIQQGFSDQWGSIFGKKGLMTMAVLGILPFLLKFLKNPLFPAPVPGTSMNENPGREIGVDEEGNSEYVENYGYNQTTGKIARNAIVAGVKVADPLIRAGINGGKEFIEKYGKKKAVKAGTEVAIRETTEVVAEKASNIAIRQTVEAGGKKSIKEFTEMAIKWVKEGFSNSKVIKLMGESAAKETCDKVLASITKALSGAILEKFSKKITKAVASVTARTAGALGTSGVLTAVFAVSDFATGALEADRLFNVPSGSADFTMKTISAVLQTLLGIGMIGPILDVLNEIISEVSDMDLKCSIATIAYSVLTFGKGTSKLADLQLDFDTSYEKYKVDKKLPNLTENAYNDIINPTAWGKVKNSKAGQFVGDTWDKTKELGTKIGTSFKEGTEKFKTNAKVRWDKNVAKGHSLTNNVFNDDKIRQDLGLNENVKLGAKDRASMVAATFLERLTGGKVDSSEAVKSIYGTITQIQDKTKASVENFRAETSKFWDSIKTGIPEALSNANKTIGSSLGFFDDEGNSLSMTEGFKALGSKALVSIKDTWNDVKFGAQANWINFKNNTSTFFNNVKNGISSSVETANKHMGSVLGFYDDDGNPLSVTSKISEVVTGKVTKIKDSLAEIKSNSIDFWESSKKTFSDGWKKLKEGVSGAIDKADKALGSFFGIEDDNGEPKGLTTWVSEKIDNTKNNVKNFFSSSKNTTANDVNNRNRNANTAKGGELNGMPYFSQNDPRYAGRNFELSAGKGDNLSMSYRGCGPTTMAMVASQLTGKQIDPMMMANMATSGGYNVESGTRSDFFNDVAPAMGMSVSQQRTSKSNLTGALKSGKHVILRGQSNGEANSPFTSGGHYVVGVKSANGKVTINDPRGIAKSGEYDMDQVLNQSNLMWSFDKSGKTNKSITTGGSVASKGEAMMQYALEQLGKPYIWGAEGKVDWDKDGESADGYDCSGLVSYAANKAGVNTKGRNTASGLYGMCTKISKSQLVAGDLGFCKSGGKVTHVGIYLGNDEWVEAMGGKTSRVVRVPSARASKWNAYGRLAGVNDNADGFVPSTDYANTNGNSTLSDSVSSSPFGFLGDITGFIGSQVGVLGKNLLLGKNDSYSTYNDYLASKANGETLGMTADGSSIEGEHYSNTSLGSRKTNAEVLNRELGGRLSGKGSSIIAYGNKYGVDPAFASAIMRHESTNGTSNFIMNRNNPGGIMDWDNGWKTGRNFSTLDGGIEYTVKNLHKNYLSQGLDTISEIGAKYAPIGAANDPRGLNKHWVPNITDLYNTMSYVESKDTSTVLANKGNTIPKVTGGPVAMAMGGDEVIPDIDYGTLDLGNSLMSGMGDVVSGIQSIDFNSLKTSDNSDSTDRVVNVLEKVLDSLGTIAGASKDTAKGIKDALSKAINNINSSSSVNVTNNNISAGGGNTKQTTKSKKPSMSQDSSSSKDRSIAMQIAAGKFI